MNTVKLCPAVVAVTLLITSVSRADVPMLTAAELQESSTHVVEGKVRAIYRYQKDDGGFRKTYSVAEVAVTEWKKAAPKSHKASVVYVHYWNQEWIGPGDPIPATDGHIVPPIGKDVRLFLKKKNSRYNLLLPNGTQTLRSKMTRSEKSADMK